MHVESGEGYGLWPLAVAENRTTAPRMDGGTLPAGYPDERLRAISEGGAT
jgi:hypothetical protein